MADAINPSHYEGVLFIPKEQLPDYLDKDGNLSLEYMEVMQFILTEEELVGHLKGQILKYLFRLGKKDHPVQEAEKSQWYSAFLSKFLRTISSK